MEKQILSAIKAMEEMMDDITTVCVCNSKTLKVIEERADDLPPTIVFVEDNRVEANQVLVVKDEKLKKMFLEVHKRNQLEKVERARMKGEEHENNR